MVLSFRWRVVVALTIFGSGATSGYSWADSPTRLLESAAGVGSEKLSQSNVNSDTSGQESEDWLATTKSVDLDVGWSRTFKLKNKLIRASVSDSSIANAVLLLENRLVLLGKLPGTATLKLSDDAGNSTDVDLKVTRNYRSLETTLQTIDSRIKFKVHSVNGTEQVVLVGDVDRLESIIQAFAASLVFMDDRGMNFDEGNGATSSAKWPAFAVRPLDAVLVSDGRRVRSEIHCPAPPTDPAESCADISMSVRDFGSKYKLLGLTHQPIGKLLTLEGLVVNRPYQKHEELTVRVQCIDGKPTQENIQIRLHGIWDCESLKENQTFRLRGWETGSFVGLPGPLYGVFSTPRIPFPSPDFHFSNEFDVLKAVKIDPIQYSPADFVDKYAVMQGTAISDQHQSWIQGSGWRILVNASSAWPDWMEGKAAEAYGLLRRTKNTNTYKMHHAEPHLVNLSDQVGHKVTLRATARFRQNYEGKDTWYLDYRGQDVYVDKLGQLPEWSFGNYGEYLIVAGTLYQAKRPDLNQVNHENPELKDYFVVGDASWRPCRDRASLYPEVSSWWINP